MTTLQNNMPATAVPATSLRAAPSVRSIAELSPSEAEAAITWLTSRTGWTGTVLQEVNIAFVIGGALVTSFPSMARLIALHEDAVDWARMLETPAPALEIEPLRIAMHQALVRAVVLRSRAVDLVEAATPVTVENGSFQLTLGRAKELMQADVDGIGDMLVDVARLHDPVAEALLAARSPLASQPAEVAGR